MASTSDKNEDDMNEDVSIAGPSYEGKNQESVRRSFRKRTQVPKEIPGWSEFMTKSKKNVPWSKQEKVNLLKGLKQVGEKDILNLTKFVPTKTPAQIMFYISSLKNKLPAFLKSENPEQADYWIDHCKNATQRVNRMHYDPLPISMLLISLFEELPDSDHPSGVDFPSLYEYMFAEMAEVQRPQLNMKTKYFLYKTLQDLQKDASFLKDSIIKELKDSSVPKEWPFSSRALNPLKFPKIQLDHNKGA